MTKKKNRIDGVKYRTRKNNEKGFSRELDVTTNISTILSSLIFDQAAGF